MTRIRSVLMLALVLIGSACGDPQEVVDTGPSTTSVQTTTTTTQAPPPEITTTSTLPSDHEEFVMAYRAVYPTAGGTSEETAALGIAQCSFLADNSGEALADYFVERNSTLGEAAAANIRTLMTLATDTICPEYSELLDAAAESEQEAETELATADYEAGHSIGFDLGYRDGTGGSWSYQPPQSDQSAAYSEGHSEGYSAGFGVGLDLYEQEVAAQEQAAFDQWCIEYKFDLETAGTERAQSTPSNPFRLPGEPVLYYYGMNRGMYKDWVVVPLVDAGCPRPVGY